MAQNEVQVQVQVDGQSLANAADASSQQLNQVVKKHSDQLGVGVSRLAAFAARLGGISGALSKTISTFAGTGGLIGVAGLAAKGLSLLEDAAKKSAEAIQDATEAQRKLFSDVYTERIGGIQKAASEGRWTQSDEDMLESESERLRTDEDRLLQMRQQLLKDFWNTPQDKGRGIVQTFQQYGRQDEIQRLADKAFEQGTSLQTQVEKWISEQLSETRAHLRAIEKAEDAIAKQKQLMADDEARLQEEKEKALQQELDENERLRQKEDAFREKLLEDEEKERQKEAAKRDRELQKELEAGEKLRRMEEAQREKELEDTRGPAWMRWQQKTSLSNQGIYMGEQRTAAMMSPEYQLQKSQLVTLQSILQQLR